MGQLFDLNHIAYIIVSLALTIIVLVLGKRHLKSAFTKDVFLKFFALSTFFLHLSPLWVDYLRHGAANVAANMIFPIFFCNLSMYMLVVAAFWANKQGKSFQAFAIVTAYGGVFGALISLFYPSYYLGAASMFEWGVFKSLVSHSTMLIGAAWLFIAGYFKIRLTNTLVFAFGLIFYGFAGVIVNTLYEAFGLPDPNAMYLSQPPLAEAPFLNAYAIALIMLILIGGFSLTYERYACAPSERTIKRLA
ncbi:MAG: hypothetical protein EA375_04740 [Acholeplasmataceae bacterium]|nr:MAG: hypothetical protein EA375_04740 [Acholeplasmataceae bacterium]